MGFYAMAGALLLGIILAVLGAKKGRENKYWYVALVAGLIFIGVGVWLGLPR